MSFLALSVSGLSQSRQRFALLRAALAPALRRGIDDGLRTLATQLSDAAPKGSSQSEVAPAGDAPGRLADSFVVATEETGAAVARGTLRTTQPTKLGYVMKGTGTRGPRGQRITPRTARALYWEGAEHPVRSVRGMAPNDFVTPVLQNAGDVLTVSVGTALGETLRAA